MASPWLIRKENRMYSSALRQNCSHLRGFRGGLPLNEWKRIAYKLYQSRAWRNWQTRRIQVPVLAREWRFDSSRPHCCYETVCVDST